MLTFNRLDYLDRHGRRPRGADDREPYRLTIVDNASGADVRSWLAENRHRFHQVILRPTNEHLPGVPARDRRDDERPVHPLRARPDRAGAQPCWLTRCADLSTSHPDFGIIGMGLDPVNRPSVLGPEVIDPAARVGDDIVEGNLGMWFQMIRREALLVPYELDAQACEAVRGAGYRVGWIDTLRSYHLGWDDYKLHPGHLASKNPKVNKAYSHYREIELIDRPPTLSELANAAPGARATREAGIPDASVLELAWSAPAVAAAVQGAVGVDAPAGRRTRRSRPAPPAPSRSSTRPPRTPRSCSPRRSAIAARHRRRARPARRVRRRLPARPRARRLDRRRGRGPGRRSARAGKAADADPALADNSATRPSRSASTGSRCSPRAGSATATAGCWSGGAPSRWRSRPPSSTTRPRCRCGSARRPRSPRRRR